MSAPSQSSIEMLESRIAPARLLTGIVPTHFGVDLPTNSTYVQIPTPTLELGSLVPPPTNFQLTGYPNQSNINVILDFPKPDLTLTYNVTVTNVPAGTLDASTLEVSLSPLSGSLRPTPTFQPGSFSFTGGSVTFIRR